jgi:plasmid replication initiation protein
MKKTKETRLIVNKSYKLNAMRQGYATLREQRIFVTYLARINPLNPESRTIRLAFEEFAELCEIKEERNIETYRKLAKNILNKIVILPLQNGGFDGFVLFERCVVSQDNKTGEWFFEMTATQTAMPYFFDIKPYFSYELQSALKLKSLNQIRFYEIIKQREKIGVFDIKLSELRELLGILPEEYPEYKHFKQNVLEPCKKEINNLTDINFDYTAKRIGRKVGIISFTIITKNDDKINSKNKQHKTAKIFSQPQTTVNISPRTLENKQITLNEAQLSPLWENALSIAQKARGIRVSPEYYALGIISNWINNGYRTVNDLTKNGEISIRKSKNAEKNMLSFDLETDEAW